VTLTRKVVQNSFRFSGRGLGTRLGGDLGHGNEASLEPSRIAQTGNEKVLITACPRSDASKFTTRRGVTRSHFSASDISNHSFFWLL